MLTPREVEILSHSSQGLPAKCIAPMLGISERTVEFHRENAVRKLGAANILKACCDAIRLGIIPAVTAVGVAVVVLSGEQVRLDIESYQELHRVRNGGIRVEEEFDCVYDPLHYYDPALITICEDE